MSSFRNEPYTDFTQTDACENMQAALTKIRGSLGRQHPLVIGGQAVDTREWLPSLNPADQREVIGLTAKASLAEADAAISAACRAQPEWGRTPVDERAALLQRLANRMRSEKAELTALIILEAGKPWAEADADVAEAIDFCEFYAAQIPDLAGFQETQSVEGETNLQHWLPRGTGVVIAPWNFPLAILTGMVTAAMAGGNTVVMKPSGHTPVIAARLMAMLAAAGMPDGVANLLTGAGSELGDHLTGHPQIDFVAFTGSKETGLRIWEMAGRTVNGQRNLRKVVCEMGGKNALIVDAGADLEAAVRGALRSAFGYSGQKCSALSRLIVHEQCHDEFMGRLRAEAARLRIGRAEDEGSTVVPVISREAQRRIIRIVTEAEKTHRIAWRGEPPADEQACFVPPVIFEDVPPSSRLFREEIFGPVVAVTRARDFVHALALANDSDFALTGGVFSRDEGNLARAKAEFQCGNLYLNRPITGALVGRQPFGGFRMSGGGTKAGGREYLQHFLFPRVVTENVRGRSP